MKYETLAIHAGERTEGVPGVNVPIELSTTFVQKGIHDYQDYQYSRGNNPTRHYLETLVADLEGAKYALATSSGMAASSLVFGLLKEGNHVLFSSNVYGGTFRYFSNLFEDRGIKGELVDDVNNLKEEDLKDVTAIFIETPSNPLLEVYDIEHIASLAHANNALLIVDNTFLTSYFQKPLDFGADIVVYSATKYYGGHSDVIAGLVVTNNDDLYTKLKFLHNTYGNILSPFDSFLLQRGIKTLGVRLDRHQNNALRMAEYLDNHQAVKKVYYPGLQTHPGHDIQIKQARGYGAVLSFILEDDYDSKKFVDELKIIDLAVSLGGIESLICHPSSMTHESYPIDLQQKIGIEEGLLRLSVGIENIQDLLNDIEHALENAHK
ncbi:PLP-dependent aspartate aminotransferase family protein [uncultured Catenibacterium sp.]|uniref:trans-sulfuration enzyme family protein n=1 Tax=uncultured Catenibacterium sp. TaxID=286142 RepID=UPI0025ED7A50|nr:PLP-dependent aspartate aminotransferase family protein [uncultured Catenibacterium sp.]